MFTGKERIRKWLKFRENGAVYFNRVGGKPFSVNHVQFCRRKNLVFPDFKESDIRIKKQTGGTHYYAYIGDMQVRDGDILKWNTFDEAYKRAYELVIGEGYIRSASCNLKSGML